MSLRPEILWTLLAALGGGAVAAHRALPPGHTAAGVLPSLSAAATSPAALLWAAGTLTLLLLLPYLLRYAFAALRESPLPALRRSLLPLSVGISAPLPILLLEGVFFRCPLPAVLLSASLIGALAAGWRVGALAALRDRTPRPIWLAAATILLLAPLALSWPAPQGDEPHYLLASESLIRDGDLDLAADYGEGRYKAYHPAPLSPHYKPGLREGSRYSMHGPGYPVALLPAGLVGIAFGGGSRVAAGRLLQVILYGLFVLLLHRTLRERVGDRAAAFGTLGTAWLSPFVFAPLHLFPETLLMALGLLGFRWIGRGRLPAWVAGLPLAALPWLAAKTIPLAIVLAVATPWVRCRPSVRRAFGVAAPLLLSLALHALFTWILYGSLSPSALYLGSDPDFGRQPGYGASLTAYLADWPGAIRTLFGYLIDQKEGLFFTGPHWLLAAAGLPWLWRHRRRELLVLLLALAAYVGPYALSQQIGGQSPPARPLMAVSWILAWPLGVGLAVLAYRPVAALRGALVVAGAALTATFVLDPRLLPHDYPVTSSWLLRSLSPRGVHLETWFPLWLNVRDTWPWAVALGWLAALAGLAYVCARWVGPLPESGTRPQPAGWAGATLGALLAGAVGLWGASLVVTDRHSGADLGGGLRAWVVHSIPEGAWAETDGVWVAGGGRREVVLTSAAARGELALELRGLVQQPVKLELPAGTRMLDLDTGWTREEWAPSRGYAYRGRRAWLLGIDVERAISPAELAGGEDHRRLGALLRVRAGRDE